MAQGLEKTCRGRNLENKSAPVKSHTPGTHWHPSTNRRTCRPMRLLLIDGHYYLYRSFFAIRGLTNSRGEPTNAIYGFLKAMRKMVTDLKTGSWRRPLGSGLARSAYFAPVGLQTTPPRDASGNALPGERGCKHNLPLTGFASLSAPSTEADDLIASYTRKAVRGRSQCRHRHQRQGHPSTHQRTCSRSIRPQRRTQGTNGICSLGTTEIKEKWGVEPSQIAEILALTGDSSDNIPGVPGRRGKDCRPAHSQAYGTVENLSQQLATVQPEKLRATTW